MVILIFYRWEEFLCNLKIGQGDIARDVWFRVMQCGNCFSNTLSDGDYSQSFCQTHCTLGGLWHLSSRCRDIFLSFSSGDQLKQLYLQLLRDNSLNLVFLLNISRTANGSLLYNAGLEMKHAVAFIPRPRGGWICSV